VKRGTLLAAVGVGLSIALVGAFAASADRDGDHNDTSGSALRDFGVACVPGGASNTYSTYWTMDLAAP